MDRNEHSHDSEMHLAKQGERLQMMPIEQAKDWYNDFVNFSRSILKQDLDYGIISGAAKPSLYKPGAEKLRFVYGLSSEMECKDKTVDMERPFIDYSYRCTIKSKNGQILAQCEGSCNSMEPKYGYLWKSLAELPEDTDISKLPSRNVGKKITEFDFAIRGCATTGQYAKPKDYWEKWIAVINSGQAKKIKKSSLSGKKFDAWELDETVTLYRIINPNVMDQKNTIMKMAQKRAFVGAILLATGASEFFTQDIEDMEINGRIHSNEKPVLDEIEEEAQWHSQLEKCKTPKDVDDLALRNRDRIATWPALRKLFVDYKNLLKRQPLYA
ncbi:MAG: hypothetical protein WCF67_03950 [Chitinophagaceae bacterium]